MPNYLSDAVMKRLGITHQQVQQAHKEVQTETTQVWCFVGTKEQATAVSSEHSMPVLTSGLMSYKGKRSASRMVPGVHR